MAFNIDEVYQQWMQEAEQDPLGTAERFLSKLKSAKKKTRNTLTAIRSLESILAGDRDMWQYGAKNETDAVQFVISNCLLKGSGLTPIRFNESLVNTVASLITEDVDVAYLTPIQIRLKCIAESYGIIITPINER